MNELPEKKILAAYRSSLMSCPTFNVTLIGDASVGKTTISARLVDVKCDDSYVPTIGAAIVKIPFMKDGSEYYIYLYDTAGMEQYRSLTPIYFRESIAAVVVYDTSDLKTFQSVDYWVKLYKRTVGPQHPVLVVGNKIDKEREVEQQQALSWIEDNDCQYIEVSAKDGTNIPELLNQIINLLPIDMIERRKSIQPIALDQPSSSCC